MSWREIVDQETEYLVGVGNKLAQLQTTAQSNGALEQIYAGFWVAYNAGCEALDQFEADLLHIDRAMESGEIHVNQQMLLSQNNVPQDRWLAALHILACMRGLQRPSDVFRMELRRQQAAIIGSLQTLIRQQDFRPEQQTEDLQNIGELLCSFENPMPSESKEQREAWYKKLLNPVTLGAGIVLGTGGYFLGSYLEKKDKDEVAQATTAAVEAEEAEESEEPVEEEAVTEVEEEVPPPPPIA